MLNRDWDDEDDIAFSWVAIERMVERRAATDRKYRKMVAGRPFRSTARKLSDETLVERLGGYGVDCDRAWLGALVRRSLSAEATACSLEDRPDGGRKRDAGEVHWIWICVSVLWERWFPDEPSFEKLDDAMQAGYEAMLARDAVEACRIWLAAWQDAERLREKAGVESDKAFDELFQGTQSFFNWMQDLEMELYNAGLDDPTFFAARIRLIEEELPKFGPQDALTTENRRRALAESYFGLGEIEKTDKMYEDWLRADPRWGWGWIGWSDCYRFAKANAADPRKCEELLKKGLVVSGVRDRGEIADRLADLYEEQGRREEARAMRHKRGGPRKATGATVTQTRETGPGVLREKTTLSFGEEGLPLDQFQKLGEMLKASSHAVQPSVSARRGKIGRNEMCPCGSGKKYKKCCGR